MCSFPPLPNHRRTSAAARFCMHQSWRVSLSICHTLSEAIISSMLVCLPGCLLAFDLPASEILPISLCFLAPFLSGYLYRFLVACVLALPLILSVQQHCQSLSISLHLSEQKRREELRRSEENEGKNFSIPSSSPSLLCVLCASDINLSPDRQARQSAEPAAGKSSLSTDAKDGCAVCSPFLSSQLKGRNKKMKKEREKEINNSLFEAQRETVPVLGWGWPKGRASFSSLLLSSFLLLSL